MSFSPYTNFTETLFCDILTEAKQLFEHFNRSDATFLTQKCSKKKNKPSRKFIMEGRQAWTPHSAAKCPTNCRKIVHLGTQKKVKIQFVNSQKSPSFVLVNLSSKTWLAVKLSLQLPPYRNFYLLPCQFLYCHGEQCFVQTIPNVDSNFSKQTEQIGKGRGVTLVHKSRVRMPIEFFVLYRLTLKLLFKCQ